MRDDGAMLKTTYQSRVSYTKATMPHPSPIIKTALGCKGCRHHRHEKNRNVGTEKPWYSRAADITDITDMSFYRVQKLEGRV